MRYIYCFLTYLLVPFVVMRLLWRARKNPGYKKRMAERFGLFDMPKAYEGAIWIHVVSVGETIAATPMINLLHKQHPDKKLIITCTTPTGSERIQNSLPDDIFHVYFPYDLPGAVTRFLKKTKPCMAIFMETELWPNILHHCKKKHIPVLLANARLSERSARGYGRFQPLTRNMLQCFSIIAAQAQPDAQRFIDLGANKDTVKVIGNMKFDMQIPASLYESAELLRQQLGNDRPIFIAASTHDNEEETILRAFKKIRHEIPNCLLILVPRHPERFDKIAQLCKKQGYELVRRSEDCACTAETDIFLGDTMGELRLFFAASDIAFIGGSLIERGGHNMLEAAAFNIPVLSGPHVFNFAETSRLLNEADAMITVNNHRELAAEVSKLFKDANLRESFGQRGHTVVESNKGALDSHIKLISKCLEL